MTPDFLAVHLQSQETELSGGNGKCRVAHEPPALMVDFFEHRIPPPLREWDLACHVSQPLS